ncbi:High mobility group-T protein [Zancudomyces culisetae]|uniref:High mobility group-T protein n=1 Tax=Zancudomyces culisetae TaxID=1213189 RepID=A0A1R1PTT5_ZANCU|nr:High mobility group-T protein [Zancudomyces culisetae]|eukprot:OMH84302.1 High mobility group-T protein [Zancudomyces culisetae]
MGQKKQITMVSVTAEDAAEIGTLFGKLSNSFAKIAQHSISGYEDHGILEKGKRRKIVKDPNAPKKPLSAYFLYCSEHRKAVIASEPNISSQDISRKLGEMWKALPAEARKIYEDRFARGKESYDRENQEYLKRKDALGANVVDIVPQHTIPSASIFDQIQSLAYNKISDADITRVLDAQSSGMGILGVDKQKKKKKSNGSADVKKAIEEDDSSKKGKKKK